MIDSRGFTLIEALLSVSIMGIIAGLSIPVYQIFLVQNDLSNNTESVASSLRRAQTYARGVKDDSTWGVKVQSSVITLFKGATFATRDAAYDETTPLPSTITAGGMDEIVYTKLLGTPSTTGTITITTSNNDTRMVTINAKGMVAY